MNSGALHRIAVIGAGLAGLSAARELHRNGRDVVVFEKSRGFGGRCATRRVGEFVFDTGATVISPRTSELFVTMTQELPLGDLVEVTLPIWTMEGGRVAPGLAKRAQDRRFAYRTGMATLGKLLGEGLDVRLETTIECLTDEGRQIRVGNELFDGVIVTAPAPQSHLLLASMGIHRSFSNVRFRSCLSVLLGYATPIPPIPYFALISVEQRTPLVWLSIESAKSPDRAPDGHCALVAQMSAEYSASHFGKSDQEIVEDALNPIKRMLGAGFSQPVVSDVKRWRYSQPELTLSFESANSNGSRVLVAGDWTSGSRAENAFETGLKAARKLIDS